MGESLVLSPVEAGCLQDQLAPRVLREKLIETRWNGQWWNYTKMQLQVCALRPVMWLTTASCDCAMCLLHLLAPVQPRPA